MAKKSKDHKGTSGNKGNKGNKGNTGNRGNQGNKENKLSPSMQSLDHKPNQGRGFGNEDSNWQPGQEDNMTDTQNNQGIDLPEITTTKKSCLPKLLVLLLPIVAIGAFLLLGL